jgi:glutathione S-transferase
LGGGRARQDVDAVIGTELHKPFIRVIFPTSDAEEEVARKMIAGRFDFIAERLAAPYLFGSECSVADAYLYVMLRWARMKGQGVPEPLPAYIERMEALPAAQLTLQREGLS